MAFQPKNKIIKWVDYRLPIFGTLHHTLVDFPEPRNLNFWYMLGSISGIVLALQIVTGIVLAMHYTPHVDLAFESVEHIMRDVNYGWLLRYLHANGASMFFIAVYIHILRGMYYGSYKAPRELLWMIGVVIYLVMMATAFMGYVLPWGQMSLWGATVISNFFGAIPFVGEEVLMWITGGFSVDNATLNRFFALHYLLPFALLGLVILHILALHHHGSNNPLGIDVKGPQDTVPFHPYYTVKDMTAWTIFGLFFAVMVFYFPNFLGHPDNYIPANPQVTPPHIVPEWYFLPFYAILRSIPDKLGGVIVMFGAIAILFILPWLDTSRIRSGRFRPVFKYVFWLFVINGLVLGYVGSQPAEGSMLIIGRISTALYFLYFIPVLPLLGLFEKPLPLPTSIADHVLGKDGAAKGEG